jgi:hypothetical protein
MHQNVRICSRIIFFILFFFGNEKVVIFDIHSKGVFKTIENPKSSAGEEKK